MNDAFYKLIYIHTGTGCRVCSAKTADGSAVCPDCMNRLQNEMNILCPKCGMPHRMCLCSRDELEKSGCSAFYHVFPYFPQYESAAKSLILYMKNNRDTLCARTAARFLAQRLRFSGFEPDENTVVCHVPRRKAAIKQYGCDQSLQFARQFSRITGIKRISPLKNNALSPQKAMSSVLRRKNVEKAFSLTPGAARKIEGRRVIIIDDIVTSGSTAAVCSDMIMESGACEVIFLSLAATVRV